MRHADVVVDPRIARFLRAWLVWGATAVVLLPIARAQTEVLGWMPMYLVAMPASALWAMRWFGGVRKRRVVW